MATGAGGAAAGSVAQAVRRLIASCQLRPELADQLGASTRCAAANPANMVDVIQVLSDQERFAADAAKAAGRTAPTAPGWLASHPSSEQRLQQIRTTADQLRGQRPAGWADDGRDTYLRSIAGMGFGEGREQGVVRGHHFFHEPLGIAITARRVRIVNDSEHCC
jgi:predicted Zn-dependent protease